MTPDHQTPGTYIPIRSNGRLLFKYDPLRKLVQIKTKNETHLIDLAAVEAEAAGEPEPFSTAEALRVIRRIARK